MDLSVTTLPYLNHDIWILVVNAILMATSPHLNHDIWILVINAGRISSIKDIVFELAVVRSDEIPFEL